MRRQPVTTSSDAPLAAGAGAGALHEPEALAGVLQVGPDVYAPVLGRHGCALHSPPTVALVSHPDLLTREGTWRMHVETTGTRTRGMTVVDRRRGQDTDARPWPAGASRARGRPGDLRRAARRPRPRPCGRQDVQPRGRVNPTRATRAAPSTRRTPGAATGATA